MQFLPETVELYMSWGTSDTLEHITMTTRPTLRFTLTPYSCRFPSGTFTLQELADIYTSQTGFRLYGADVWHRLRVAKGLRATYTMHFVLNEAPMEELRLIGQPLPTAGTVAARVAAIEAKPKNEVVTPVKEKVTKPAPAAPKKKHRYNTRSKLYALLGDYREDSEDSEDSDSDWEEDRDSDGRPIRMYLGPRVKADEDSDSGENTRAVEPESSEYDSGEDVEIDESIRRTYPSKMERLLFFPQGLELYVQDACGTKWEGIRLNIQAIPPFRWGPKKGEDRGKQVRFQTPKHPEGLNEHHLIAHYRKHISPSTTCFSEQGLQCIFVAQGCYKDQSLASLLLSHSKKELQLTGSVQIDEADQGSLLPPPLAADVADEDSGAPASYPSLSADVADEDYEAPVSYVQPSDWAKAPVSYAQSEDWDEDMFKDMPPLISIAELTLERLEAKEAALEKEERTLDRIETKLAAIRALEQEVGPRRRLWCAEEFGSDGKESHLDKVEADYKEELLEIERLEARLAAVRALGHEVSLRREALLKACESM